MQDIPVTLISYLVLLLLFCCLAAVFFKRVRFPYSVGLVLLGLVLLSIRAFFRLNRIRVRRFAVAQQDVPNIVPAL